jgi:hypothetical protein
MSMIPNIRSIPTAHVNGTPVTIVNQAIMSGRRYTPGLFYIPTENAAGDPVRLVNAIMLGFTYIPEPVLFQHNPVLWGNFLFGPGYVGHDYREQWFLENVTQPVVFSLNSGSLPPGLELRTIGTTARGQIAGTPTDAGLYAFALRATGPHTNSVKNFSILITLTEGGTAFVGGN